MKKPRPALDFLAYLAVRSAVCVIQLASIDRAYRIADALAALLYRVDRRHREVAMENLRQAFGDRYTEAERVEITRGVYRHFCRMLIEILQIPRKLRATTWREHIVLRDHVKAVDRLIDDGPVILLSGHFGNWELAGYMFGVFGFAPVAVARTLDNVRLDRFLRTLRERTGQQMVPKKGGYERMLEVLQSGGVLSFLADQDAGQNGVFVDFFGRPASTHKAIALLAIEFNAPIIVGYARRVGPGFKYEVGCEEIIEVSELSGTPDDARLITQRYTSAVERLVRRDPDQYLWLHRRWKHRPRPKKAAPRGESSSARGVLAGDA